MSSTIGYTQNDGIHFAMKNYNNCKSKVNSAMKAEDVPLTRQLLLDMEYWEIRLLAAGALSLDMAAPPPHPGRYMPEDQYEAQIAKNRKLAWHMEEFNGYPLLGCVGEE